MKKTGAFTPKKFTLTIESAEGETFTVTFDEASDDSPITHGLRLDFRNRMLYEAIAEDVGRFADRVIDQLQFIATNFDGNGQGVEPHGWGWITRGRGDMPKWRLVEPNQVRPMEHIGWKVCETAELPSNPDEQTIYIIVPPKETK